MNQAQFALTAWELLVTAQAAKDLLIKQLHTEHELTPQQVRLLLQVGQTEGVPQSELAYTLDLDLGNLSRMCKVLEKKELIQRNKLPKDQRVVLVSLDTVGRKTLDAVSEKSREVLEPVVGDYTVEQLKTMTEGMELFLNLVRQFKETLHDEHQERRQF